MNAVTHRVSGRLWRLWKKLHQVVSLPEKHRRAVIRLVNYQVAAKAATRGWKGNEATPSAATCDPKRQRQDRPRSQSPPDPHRRHEDQARYFAGLEALRAHLHRSLIQVAVIADVEIPGIAAHMRYDPAWALEAYARPALPE